MSKTIVLVCLLYISLFMNSACRPPQGEIEEIFNIEKKVDLVFFYKKESSSKQKKYFDENVLMVNTDRGRYMREGVRATFRIDKNGYEGTGIKFLENATPEQRANIKKRIVESPLVYKVYEDVVPNDIEDL